jgi:hypothetical protein
MPPENETHDKNGLSVTNGCRVRITGLMPKTIGAIPPEDLSQVLSMVGEIFKVDNVDDYGQAWVYKELLTQGDAHFGHMLGLAPKEMERID